MREVLASKMFLTCIMKIYTAILTKYWSCAEKNTTNANEKSFYKLSVAISSENQTMSNHTSLDYILCVGYNIPSYNKYQANDLNRA